MSFKTQRKGFIQLHLWAGSTHTLDLSGCWITPEGNREGFQIDKHASFIFRPSLFKNTPLLPFLLPLSTTLPPSVRLSYTHTLQQPKLDISPPPHQVNRCQIDRRLLVLDTPPPVHYRNQYQYQYLSGDRSYEQHVWVQGLCVRLGVLVVNACTRISHQWALQAQRERTDSDLIIRILLGYWFSSYISHWYTQKTKF